MGRTLYDAPMVQYKHPVQASPSSDEMIIHRHSNSGLKLGGVNAWQIELKRYARTHAHFEKLRQTDPTLSRLLPHESLRRSRAHAVLMDFWEPEYSCGSERRVPGRFGDGPKWLCGPKLLPAPCTVVSLGSSYDDAFERAVNEAVPTGCPAYIVDPTLSPEFADKRGGKGAGRTELEHFREGLSAINATLNGSVGIGRDGAMLSLMGVRKPLPLVGLRRLLLERYPGNKRHVSILKVDIEGAEYDVLREAYQMCADRELTLDMMVVEFHVGAAIKSGDAMLYQLHHLRDAFANASNCDLLLHHKERNGWGCSGHYCVEFSWVSEAHAKRVFHAQHQLGTQHVS